MIFFLPDPAAFHGAIELFSVDANEPLLLRRLGSIRGSCAGVIPIGSRFWPASHSRELAGSFTLGEREP